MFIPSTAHPSMCHMIHTKFLVNLLNYQILNDVQAGSFWLGRHIHPYPCLLKMMNVEEWYPDCELSKTWMNSGRCQYKFGV